jgi:benzoyl-CoA reductase subunit BamB
LTDKDFPGMPEDNEGRFYYLLDKIVKREGIGDVLANGTYWAAKEIGKGAEEFAHNTIKKHEQLPLKLSMLNPIYFLMYSTGEKSISRRSKGSFPRRPFPKKSTGKNLRRTGSRCPTTNSSSISSTGNCAATTPSPFIPPLKCAAISWTGRNGCTTSMTPWACAPVLSSFPLKPPYHIHNYPKFISAGAGIDMDEEKLTQAAKRYRTLVRAINIRRGMRRKDDAPPANHWKKRFPELEKELLDTYYEYKGWNEQGIPTQESLHELGLDYVAEEFRKERDL